MKPVNPRLLRQASAARGYLVTATALGLAVTVLVLVQAGLLAGLLARAARGAGPAVFGGSLVALAVVLALRAAASYGSEVSALRAAARVKSQLRRKLAAHVLRLGPRWLTGRALVGGCPQDPHIFDTTIRANLLLAGPDASDAALADVACRAGLLTWIASLPAGWETLVGAHGARMSGGQRQRLALARAFLANPGLLVLDEPTAHLDADSLRAVMTDLLAATHRHGMLLITHALEGLDQLDEIVVLEHGRVVERGSHDQLASADSRYRQMLLASPSASSRRSSS